MRKPPKPPATIEIKRPTLVTLRKYGLSLDDWLEILSRQGGVCPVCNKLPTSGRFYTDHAHAKGWKAMESEDRKKYVRGILCYVCNNRLLTKGVTSEKLRNAAKYLDDFDEKLRKMVQ